MWRIYLIYFGLCLFAIFIVVKVVRIQVDASSVTDQQTPLLTDMRTIEAVRGNIYSDNGSLLATSIPIYEVRMDMKADGLSNDTFYTHVDSLAIELSRLFKDKSSAQYRSGLIEAKKEGNRYYLVKNKIRYPELQQMKKFPIFRLGKNKGGFIVIKENKRSRPYGLLAARLIGYERNDPQNPSYKVSVGLEGSYSEILNGINGKQLMKKIGNKWRPVSDHFEVNPEDGADLYTTLDINIQDVAENALLNQLKTYEAKSGSVVLMEVKTGFVKAMANLQRSEDGEYYEFYNQAIGTSTEPGSTFKLASAIVALEDGAIQPTDSVKTGKGVYKYYNLTMRDSKPHGTLTFHHAFEVSSNIGISKPIFEYYKSQPQKFVDGIKKLGIHLPLGLDIKGERNPYVKDPSNRNDWSGVTLPQMSIGYEVKLTPLQILAFYNAVANNGKMVKPQFIREVKKNGKTVERREPVVLNEKICSDKTLKLVHAMLEGVVERGTATNLKASSFKIAGKTGTAQILAEGSYQRKKYLASFVGYFPAEDPVYSCIVSIMEPNVETGYYGNAVAGPVFKEIADRIYSRTLELHEKKRQNLIASEELPSVRTGRAHDISEVISQLEISSAQNDQGAEWVRTVQQGKKIQTKPVTYAENKVPDVKGMGLKDALFLLENRGLVVKIKGSGKVRNQSISSGVDIVPGETILLELM